ncbi:hypothetical protein LshimejAT787_1004150 [Lyophyllum shimeji]|uniref:Uncharacterized protein n=1 Tax=Lyophyllum shimeji TaxID=47721 RepID=A0A9P3URX3_LYOSH|nr:hypothetical protein LshimejAT787_1004150 [Lyophyllum shimeji]
MDAVASDSVTLPIELIEHIILVLWSSPLSANDRITFMTSSLLVNKVWMSTFTRIASRDVHIPCPSYREQYMRTLAGCSSLFDKQSQSLPSTLLRSVTVKIRMTEDDAAALKDDEQDPPMGKTLESVLYELSLCNVPNLRTLHVEYENMGFDDVFQRGRFIAFPAQINNLVISFSFDPEMAAMGELLRVVHERQHPYIVRGHQRMLSKFGLDIKLALTSSGHCFLRGGTKPPDIVTEQASLELSKAIEGSRCGTTVM